MQLTRPRWLRRLGQWLSRQSLPIDGWDRIGRMDFEGVRSLWVMVDDGGIHMRAGRVGNDDYVYVSPDNPIHDALANVLSTAVFAASWESPTGQGAPDLLQTEQ